MIRSFAFTTQSCSKNIESFLMPTLLADTNLFLWVDLEKPTPEEAKLVLEEIFHFHPLSVEDCVQVSSSPKVEEFSAKEEEKFAPYLFMVIHAVDLQPQGRRVCHQRAEFFSGPEFFSDLPRGSIAERTSDGGAVPERNGAHRARPGPGCPYAAGWNCGELQTGAG
jgi:magnesium transporter